MRICGVDPGLQITGYGVVEAVDGSMRVVEAGVIRPGTGGSLEGRLAKLVEGIEELLGEHKPGVMAVEALYSHYRHPRTAIMMGHARGVILASAARRDVEVLSFSATEIKKSLTGNGQASKTQMQRAIVRTLALPRIPEPADVADALAVALCATQRRGRRAAR